MRCKILLAFVFSIALLGQAAGQDESELNILDEKLSHHLKGKMVGWKHKRSEPIEGSRGVLIEFWSIPNRVVKISVAPHKSVEDARQSLQYFVKYTKEAEPLKGFGDEAYAWGYGGSDVVFRRGKFTVYVSTHAEVGADPDTHLLSSQEKGERERSEMRRLSREFAKHMVSAIDEP